MRSRNVSPGSAVMRTTIRSDRTRRAAGDRRAVAAALADDGRRLAGDRRLVHRGDPLDHLAVARDHLAGLDDDHVALAQRRRRGPAPRGPPTRLARHASPGAGPRRAAAWAFPRPSASASAKFAKSTVNQSQSATWPVKAGGAAPGEGATRSRSQMSVVRTLPTSTTNMTGLRAIIRGSSLRRLSTSAARRTRALPGRDGADTLRSPWLRTPFRPARGSARRSGRGSSTGKNVSAPTITITPDEQDREERPVRGQRARARRRRSSCRPGCPRSRGPGRSSRSARRASSMPEGEL